MRKSFGEVTSLVTANMAPLRGTTDGRILAAPISSPHPPICVVTVSPDPFPFRSDLAIQHGPTEDHLLQNANARAQGGDRAEMRTAETRRAARLAEENEAEDEVSEQEATAAEEEMGMEVEPGRFGMEKAEEQFHHSQADEA